MKRLNRMLHTVTALGALAGTTALAATGVSLDVSRVELAVQLSLIHI